MGPGVKARPRFRQDHVYPDSKTQRDTELSRLRAELERCNMKIAQFQARLVTVLDELDAQRHLHERELRQERRAKEKLSNKLDTYLDEVQRAETERDEMRELVSILLEKVESCHDYSAWPSTRIDLAYPVEPIRQSRSSLNCPGIGQDGDGVMRNALVALLQKQLAEEQAAHAITREEACAEIVRLKAMIARRDAELESCATHDGHRILLSYSGLEAGNVCTHLDCASGRKDRRADSGATCPHDMTLGDHMANERDHVLATTLTRNRVLEREIDLLKQRVSEAQGAQSQGARTTVSQESTRYVSVAVQTSQPDYPTGPFEYFPPSPGILPYTMPSSPSPYCLTPLHGRTPPGQKGPSRFSKTFQSRIRGLEKDVDQFSAALNDFIIERTELKAMLSHEHRKDSVVEGNGHADGSSRITALLDQITKDQRALREQLDAVERGRTHREKELESEIATLRQALLDFQQEARRHSSPRREERSSTPGVVPSGNTLHAAKSLSPQISPTLTANDTHALHVEQTSDQPEADIETRRVSDNEGLTLLHADELGEQPMELATPLPTTILSLCEDDWLLPAAHPASSSAQPATDLNPADIPLPHSPQYEPTPKFMLSPRPSPTPSSPPDFPIARAAPDLTRMESTTEARIALIEREIIDTQRQLEAKEALLAGLRGPAVEPHSPSQAHDHDSHPCTDSEGPAPSPEC